MSRSVESRVAVAVRARDPISQAGLVSQLRSHPEVELAEGPDAAPDVVLVVTDAVDEALLRDMRKIRRDHAPRAVRGLLIVTQLDERQLLSAAECGFAGIMRRTEAHADWLVDVLTAVARGEAHVPRDVLGALLDQVARLQGEVLEPRGLTFSVLSPRELDILRLVSEGHDTAEISQKLTYSERTIKNDLHAVMTRWNLHSRSHAVAYAIRQGLI
jgi:DNA-binding NarL/FixJ family response regulator